jgi:hypothetical protein
LSPGRGVRLESKMVGIFLDTTQYKGSFVSLQVRPENGLLPCHALHNIILSCIFNAVIIFFLLTSNP